MKEWSKTEDSSCPEEAPMGSSCEVRAPQVQLVWFLWDGCGQRLQVQNLGPRTRKKSHGWRHFSLVLQVHLQGSCPWAGTKLEQETWGLCCFKARPGGRLQWQKTRMDLFNIHFNFLLVGLFVWLRLERRKLHFPDSLAPKVWI